MGKVCMLVEDYRKTKHKEYIKKIAKSALEIKFKKIFSIDVDDDINIFNIKSKQSYYNNSELYTDYINYFIEYYDEDNELLLGYLKLKFMIDRQKNKYGKNLFIDDCFSYLLSESMQTKIKAMVSDNYKLDLKTGVTKYKAIEFNNYQGQILLQISMTIKIFIPIVTHYISVNNIKNKGKGTDAFLGKVFLKIIPYFEDGNLYNKMFEFVNSKVNKSKAANKDHWNKIGIFGKDIDSETESILSKVFVDIFFKYVFSKNIIALNSTSIRNNVDWSLRTNFDLNLRPISDVAADENSLSDFDKMELSMSKFDESFVIMGNLNIKQTIKKLKRRFNVEYTKEELEYYQNNITSSVFQKDLIFKLFANYFGNTRDLYSLSLREYTKLICIMKKMMHDMGYVILQHIFTGKITSMNTHKKLSKKQKNKIVNSKEYGIIKEKYKSTFDIISKENGIFKDISLLLNCNVTLVDYQNKDKTGRNINIYNNQNIIIYEYLKYIEMI